MPEYIIFCPAGFYDPGITLRCSGMYSCGQFVNGIEQLLAEIL
jgi:hypothetical protein